LKDVVLSLLINGIPVDRPCRCKHVRVKYEENEIAPS
jgi:hypothetical protein